MNEFIKDMVMRKVNRDKSLYREWGRFAVGCPFSVFQFSPTVDDKYSCEKPYLCSEIYGEQLSECPCNCMEKDEIVVGFWRWLYNGD